MKIITSSKEIEYKRVVGWRLVSTFQELGDIAAENAELEHVLLYSVKSESGILFLLSGASTEVLPLRTTQGER